MKFYELQTILEKREYKHRQGYEKNEKGSYINKGKTKWDYSGDATPGNERLVSQIQYKAARKFDSFAPRDEIKKFLKSDSAKKMFKRFKETAQKKFGSDEDNQSYRAYLYGGFAVAVAKSLSKKK